MPENFSINNQTKGKLPNLPLKALKNDILGEKYVLSIALIGKKKMKNLNKTYRGKDKATNILSFPLSKKEGELILCPEVIKKETKKFGLTFPKLLQFLVIHGCLHLKGMSHGSTMDKAEQRYLSRTKTKRG